MARSLTRDEMLLLDRESTALRRYQLGTTAALLLLSTVLLSVLVAGGFLLLILTVYHWNLLRKKRSRLEQDRTEAQVEDHDFVVGSLNYGKIKPLFRDESNLLSPYYVWLFKRNILSAISARPEPPARILVAFLPRSRIILKAYFDGSRAPGEV